MGFVLLYRDSQGNVTFLDKIFSSEAEVFEFVKSHSAAIRDYEILSESEYQQFMAEQQASAQQSYQQRRGGYQQRVEAYSDEREPEQQHMNPRPVMMRNYRPAFVSPTFIGKKIRR
jgi:hypothetical protein